MESTVKRFTVLLSILVTSLVLTCTNPLETVAETDLDKRVRSVLDSESWRDMNVPEVDGQILYDTVLKNGYTRALEIGTSTGFEAAGLSKYIDARLGDAHEIVPALEGPFDFVFSDADKGWYKNYLVAVLPKLDVGGCYTTHNVSRRRRNSDYLEFLLSLENLETTIDSRGSGMSISYKKAD
jgi:predicted O-methyltransferase YrrM